MTGTGLRDALHDVASAGVGPVTDARLAVLSDLARGGDAPSVSGGGGRRRWVVGAVAVAAVAALVVVGVAQALRPVEVTPASGPGSLPDQIFPSREHILTLEQAPIGRVSMVFATSSLTGDAAPAWIAVGADTDEYRWVAPVDPGDPKAVYAWSTLVEISPDGQFIAVGYSGDDGPLLHVEVIDASTGAVEDVMLGETVARLGGEIEGLSWSPSGRRLVVESAVVIERTSETGRRWEQRLFMVDGLTEEDRDRFAFATVQGVRPEGGDQLVGWAGESPVVVSYAGRSVTGSDGVTQREGALRVVGGSVTRRAGTVADVPDRASVHGLSPSGSMFAGLSDLTPSVSGDGDWALTASRTSDGRRIWLTEQIPELGAEVVGWSNEQTPVLFTTVPGKGLNAPTQAQLVEFGPQNPSANGEIMVDLSGDGSEQIVRIALSAEVLAAGEVRDAQPPHQPWYDPRTLGPAVRDLLGGWAGNAAAQGLALVLLVVAGLVLVTRRINRRRRRAAHSRSSA